ncbi:MAG: SH3 domain-containing protein, partial [candidate division NC10 bacterium]|nr:SH3 domain-containing protein [candidate division NC10 bacterium]
RWVDRAKADVRVGRGSYYDVVDTVLKGEQVQVVTSVERWLQVRTPRAKTGWILEAALNKQPVDKATSDFLKLVPGDASTSAVAASTGAKGVYAQAYAREKGYDYGVVSWVESNQPPAGDIDVFVRDGGLRSSGGAQ